jgi:hypothetical protein
LDVFVFAIPRAIVPIRPIVVIDQTTGAVATKAVVTFMRIDKTAAYQHTPDYDAARKLPGNSI